MPGLITPVMQSPQMPSQGLMLGGAIGQGLSSFADSYLKAKQVTNQQNFQQQELGLMQQREQREQQQQQGLLQLKGAEAGYNYDPTSGFSPTDFTKQKISYAQQGLDPNSPRSQQTRDQTRRMLNSVSDGLGDNAIDDNMTANDIEGNPILKATLQLKAEKEIKEQENQRLMTIFGNRLNEQDFKDAENTAKSVQGRREWQNFDGLVHGANPLKDQIMQATYDKMAAKGLGVAAARYQTGGQRMNQIEIKALGGKAGDIKTNIQQTIYNGLNGTITPDQANYMSRWVDAQAAAAQREKDAIEDESTGRYARIKKMDPNMASQRLWGRDVGQPSQAPGPNNLQPPAGFSPEDWGGLSPTAQRILRAIKGGQ